MGEYDDLFDRGEYAIVPLEEQLVKMRKRLPVDAQARAVTEDRPQNRHAGVQVEGDDTRTSLEWPERQPTSPPCSRS